ncbi:ABATE domain-containing protein [Kitasatospora camelliae]|uniref:ABATE domain-containing protein n=1 Tax=Kitasatospora camelliae TaxID=3156397 RepID=A0AAU8JT77_9ACTN
MDETPYHLHQPAVPGEEQYRSLALVNTRFTLSHGPVDLLEDADAARLWLVRRELLPDRTALAGRQHGRLLALRESARALFAARAAAGAPPPTALDALNAALAAAPPTPHLLWDTPAGGPRRADRPDHGNPVGAALSLLAEDTADLLTGPEAEQLAECAAQGCDRWFLRSHAARRWCCTKCGNRVRAARAYAARKTR